MKPRVLLLLCLFITTCGKDTAVLQLAQTPVDAAVLSIGPSLVFNFPDQTVGGTENQPFAVSNTGGKPATEMQSDFGLSITFSFPGGYPGTGGTCAGTLAAGASCTLVVQFSPQYIGSFQQTLRVSYLNAYSVVFTDYPVLNGNGK